jgi:dihydroorotate dehydrogenase subfamily 1
MSTDALVPDLRVELAGLSLRNPVIAASSEFTMTEAGITACLDAGAGAVIAKSVNENPASAQQLDIADYVLLDEHHRATPWSTAAPDASLFNRSGLAQAPLPDWLAMLERCEAHAREVGSLVIGSITVSAAEPAAEIASQLQDVVRCIELNLSAPHGREVSTGAVRQLSTPDAVLDYTRTVRAAVDCPLIVKLTGQTDDVVALARAARDGGADVVAMIGRFQGFVPDLETRRPVLSSYGGIGGRWALPVSLYWVSKAHVALPETPLVGTNGARDGDDVLRFLLSGAAAVELASAVLMRGPAALRDAIAGVSDYLAQHRIPSVRDLIGAATREVRSYADLVRDSSPATQPWPWEKFR